MRSENPDRFAFEHLSHVIVELGLVLLEPTNIELRSMTVAAISF